MLENSTQRLDHIIPLPQSIPTHSVFSVFSQNNSFGPILLSVDNCHAIVVNKIYVMIIALNLANFWQASHFIAIHQPV